jgi:Flp pilus assembly protein TadG
VFTRAGRGTSGSVMLEFVLAFPLILVLLLACMQFAHMWMARQVVQYAAFAAARATLVCTQAEYQQAAQQAAEQVCAWISIGVTAGEKDKRVPGWGRIPGSGGVARKTRVRIETVGRWNVRATVEHDFALVFPLVGPIIGWGVSPWDRTRAYAEQHADMTGNVGDTETVRYPHVRFTEKIVMTKPYVTLPRMGLPASGW